MNVRESDNVSLWFKRAEDDLSVARALSDKKAFFPHIVAYHCHESAEKALKAFLIARQTPYPKTHDLVVLLNLSKNILPEFNILAPPVSNLNPLYIEEKYPFEPVEDYCDKQLRSFVTSAKQIFDFVKAKIC